MCGFLYKVERWRQETGDEKSLLLSSHEGLKRHCYSVLMLVETKARGKTQNPEKLHPKQLSN